MAKARLVRPEIWTDGKFVSMSPLARLLFVGMWNFACDNGHVSDSLVELKMRVLPADDCDLGDLLGEILESEMIVRKGGYLKVVNLSEKQPLDLRFLVFCGHCADDPERHYTPADKKPSRGTHASNTRAERESPTGARRSVVVDGDVDGGGSKPPAAKRSTSLPEDFRPTESHIQLAEQMGVNLRAEWAKFGDHFRANGKTYKDWNAVLNNWIRRAAEYAGRPAPLTVVTDETLLPPVEESWMRRRK